MPLRCRHALPSDLDRLIDLETMGFPPEKAAGPDAVAARLAAWPDHFWLLCEGDRTLAYACGMATSSPRLVDAMYADPGMHEPDGAWQTLFSVCTDPAFRRRGLALRLLGHVASTSAERGRRGVVLACLAEMRPLYLKAGYADEGVSPWSRHGGAVWRQMRLLLG